MKICIAQLRPSVGDPDCNLRKIERAVQEASEKGAQLVVFPEMFLTGYPPKDLLLQNWFAERVEQAAAALAALSAKHPELGILCGLPTSAPGGKWHNSAVLMQGGEMRALQHKTALDDSVFDEHRYFVPGEGGATASFEGETLTIAIGEDSLASLAGQSAALGIVIAASPFHLGKPQARISSLQKAAKECGFPLVFVNQAGGQDELIFDGASIFCDSQGRVTVLPVFAEATLVIDTDAPAPASTELPASDAAWLYGALKQGLHDYLAACGQARVILGLSGGIDSAVVCALAADVLGPENVRGVIMPGPFSSPGSVTDAEALAANLGIKTHVVPITDLYEAYLGALKDILTDRDPDVTEENIQARIRGSILMAFANRFGGMVLATSNKSESAVGYATMYGDMVGGMAPLADVYKTQVYALAEYINGRREIIPQSTIMKPPSAELRPGQKDEDSLPPYKILDPIIAAYVEEGRSAADIVSLGYAQETVDWVIKNVNRMEFKRRQAAPCIRVTKAAFGAGRRMPIAAKY